MAKKNQKKPQVKVRNWHVVNARTRHTAGQMGDKRKQDSKTKCRKRIER